MKAINTPLYQSLRKKLPKGRKLEVRKALDVAISQLCPDGKSTVEMDPATTSLYDAFVWKLSPQGHEYWAELVEEFELQ